MKRAKRCTNGWCATHNILIQTDVVDCAVCGKPLENAEVKITDLFPPGIDTTPYEEAGRRSSLEAELADLKRSYDRVQSDNRRLRERVAELERERDA